MFAISFTVSKSIFRSAPSFCSDLLSSHFTFTLIHYVTSVHLYLV